MISSFREVVGSLRIGGNLFPAERLVCDVELESILDYRLASSDFCANLQNFPFPLGEVLSLANLQLS